MTKINKAHKFRVYDGSRGKWLDPNKICITGGGELLEFDAYPNDKNSPQKQWTRLYIKESLIIQEFTGEVDSKGTPIYEGDVVEYEDWDNGYGHEDDPIETGCGVVVWGHMAYGGYTKGWYIDEYKTFYSVGLEKKKIRVVDNIVEKKLRSKKQI